MDSNSKEGLNTRIEAALNTIRPYLRADGGDVQIIDITESMDLHLKLLGACKTCSISEMTMTAGIEDAVKKAVPEIQNVIAVE